MGIILEELKDIYNLYLGFLILFIGLFTFFVDSKQLKDKGLNRDYIISKIVGIIYIILGPLLYIIITVI